MPDNDISKIPTLYLSPFIKLLIIVMLFLLDVDVSLLDIFDDDKKTRGCKINLTDGHNKFNLVQALLKSNRPTPNFVVLHYEFRSHG
jgi:hypothetical protein